MTCELRDDGMHGCEAQLLRDGPFYAGRRLADRAHALAHVGAVRAGRGRRLGPAARAERCSLMAVFVLIHSPFVGALTWRPTGRVLEQNGHSGIVPTLGRVSPPYWPQYANVIAEAVHKLRTNEPLVLVAHSAAGLVVPAARAALHDFEIRSYIFADAVMPRKSASLGDLIPASVGMGMKEIRAQTTAGLLPPWGTGWPEDVWRRLIPDAALRAQFADELRPTPLALYEEPVSWPEAWPDAPCRYLRFSVLYADEENEAQRSGWVTREIPGDHLHMLVRPADVAECLIELA